MWPRRRRDTRAPLPSEPGLEDAVFFDVPHELFARLRDEAPMLALRGGGYLLSRHADIRGALADPRLANAPARFSPLHARFADSRPAAALAANILPFMDRPAHSRARRVLAGALRARHAAFAPGLDALAEEAVAAVAPARRLEMIEGLAVPFSLRVMCCFIGLPEADAPGLRALSDHFFRLFAPITDAAHLNALNAGLSRFRDSVGAALPGAPGDSLLALMQTPSSAGDRLARQEVIDSAILVFADGVENVAAGAALVMARAARDAGAASALAEGGAAAGAVVDEALRLDTPAQVIARVARQEFEVQGQVLREGMALFLALGSANRDSAVFAAPDSFHPERADAGQALTFGAGRHSCLGARLARAQIVALSTALARGGARAHLPRGGLRYRRRAAHRWPEALAIALPPPRGSTSR